jgi:hypothetical protein
MIGPVCAAARARFANVVDGPAPWRSQLERGGGELLVGGDLPLRVGKLAIVPGFGGGLGEIGTHVARISGEKMFNRTGGLRAEVHAALSLPITRKLALDVAISADITQATSVETNTTMPFPAEPLWLVRLGLGVRYGGTEAP